MDTQQQIQPIRPSRPNQQNSIMKILQNGGFPTELYSTWKMATGETSYTYFANAESAGSYGSYARYNTGGKNPLHSKNGTILGFSAKLHGAAFAQPVYQTIIDDYNKLIHQAYYTIIKNKRTIREGVLAAITEPVPVILNATATGTPADTYRTVTAIQQSGINIENKTNMKHALYLPIELSDGDSLIFKVELPNNGYTIGSGLNDHLLTVYALALEYPAGVV